VIGKDKRNQFRGLLILWIIWLLGAVGDRIWFALDHSVPAWDQADYLTGTLNYWQALQHPQWFSKEWWTSFWLLSSKVPPLTYIATAIFQSLFGTGTDQATLVNLLFSGILLGSVYGLGVQLFSVEVGLWAAGLCQLLPGLYQSRLDFLLDYPLTAVVTLSFFCLTVWKTRGYKIFTSPAPPLLQWVWAAAFGLSFGLALLVKQTALFFLLTPLLWVAVAAIRKHNWGRIFQLIGGLLLSVAVFGPWYRTNWLLVLTSGKRATIDSAIAEGDPALNTLAAWTYYWKALPYQVSWLLLLVPIVGLLLYLGVRGQKNTPQPSPLVWLAIFWVGAYLLCSLNVNKDSRYVLPYLPVVSVFLAYGLTSWGGRWQHRIRWGSVGLAIMLMFFNLFPVAGVLGNGITQVLSPNAQHYTYLGTTWPHRQVIDEIIQTDPYVRSTLGVLPSTAEINQHNFNYYGALKDFQVYGRQVGTQEKQIAQDARSLDWFLTKTGDQGSVPEAQAALVQNVERSPDFQLKKSWNLPDTSTLKLYHRRSPSVQVQLIAENRRQETEDRIALSRVTVPQQTPPGVPVPVSYEWYGSWEQLQSGLVLITWQNQSISTSPAPLASQHRWLHDHSIGMGAIQSSRVQANQSADLFQVTERMAMLPHADISSGIYTLEATYLNRQTGQTYPIPVPPVTLKIDPVAPATPAPELDLVTQLRTLATALPKGTDALGPVFDEIGRINQYDPIQDYLVQTQQALEYRLQLEPQNLDWAYALALSRVLKQQVKQAIAAWERVTQLDSQNPYAYAYLGFVHLYNWHGSAAEVALKSARALSPNLPVIQALSGVAALMQGNIVKAWHYLSIFSASLAPS
jgi:4-amino-4-deoxy-L-arabinose transferase-like glycosyltransferase